MPTPITKRIESIDFLKGLVMVIMALDHVRDYFHADAYSFDPADPNQSNLPLFFTRWITHFCAPTFSFLAGTSAFFIGKRKTKKELSSFLLKRGIWLVLIELTIVNFAWYFDLQFRTFGLLVIWSVGVSMITLALLIHLPKNAILTLSLILIFGHNLFDTVNITNLFWGILHRQTFYPLNDHTTLLVGYPLVPWIAIMSLGYYFGSFYDGSYTAQDRKKTFTIIGIAALLLFIGLRATNLYGDPKPFIQFDSIPKNIISFLNPTKYPPSLLYVLMTLGGAILFLGNAEKLRGRLVSFFSTFGRVPFFYYILHLYLIHFLALFFAELSGAGWQKLILSTWINFEPNIKGYGFSLLVVYLVWIAVILMLYPLCKRFDKYKMNHKEKWWLSYL